MIRTGWIAVALSVSVVLLAAAPASASLVVNGGFETGDFTGWSTHAAASGSTFGVNGSAHSGALSAGFNATDFLHDEIFQALPTTAGQTYRLEFWLLRTLNSSSSSFQVAWEGATVFDQTPLTIPINQWNLFTLDLLATASNSELRFRAYNRAGAALLDDVSVTAAPTAIPAPGSVVLGLLGLTGVAAGRRR